MDIKSQNDSLKLELKTAINRDLKHQGYCLGPETESFENNFESWLGIKCAVGCNSGTSALHIAAKLLNLSPGDEVITTPLTFVSTSWALSYVGAKPVFADIEENSMNICPESVRSKISKKTKAILPVHLYGQMCNIDALQKISLDYNLYLVEDAAQAHGATRNGKKAGTVGDISTFSFYPGKNLGALGEGGALLTNSSDYYSRAQSLRNHGSSQKYYHDEIGFNYRMEGIQAAALSVKLRKIDQWIQKRREIANIYFSELSDLPLILPKPEVNSQPVYHLFVIRHTERDKIAAHLAEKNIQTSLHYPIPLHLQKCFSELNYNKGAFPNAEKVAAECLSIPLFPEMSENQQRYVCESIRGYFN